MQLSIVIASHNTRELLRNCLVSIRDDRPPFRHEAIVVDNASRDRSAALVSSEFPRVRLIKNRINRGFAAACNQGAAVASGRWLLFLNSDTLVHPGTLEKAVRFMERHPEAGLMGCRAFSEDGRVQPAAFPFPAPLRIFAWVAGLNRILKISRFRDHDLQRTPGFVLGAFMIISRDLFARVDRFDERFFFYGEDVDLCQRVRKTGLKIYYSPEMSITHFGSGSTRHSLTSAGWYIASNLRLYEKYRGAGAGRRLRRWLKLAVGLRFVTEFLFSPVGYRQRIRDIRRLYESIAEGQ